MLPQANEVLRRMAAHRTIRDFLDTPVPDADIRNAVEASQMASTSSWIQAYHLLQVTDMERRRKLRELTGDQAQVERAGAFFCICGDVRRHQLIARDAGAPHVGNLESFLQVTIDAALFAQNLGLAFESQGYGICFIGGLRNQLAAVDQLLELPAGVLPFFGLCVGEPAPASGPGNAQRPRLAVDAVWTKDRYPDDEQVREQLEEMDARAAVHYEQRGLPGRNWTGGIWRSFREPHRTHLRDYYTSKGASFE